MPPLIQVTEPAAAEVAEMETTEKASAPPMTPELPVVEKSRNPFLSMDELMGDVGSDKPGDEKMLLDDKDVAPPQPQVLETNPFRKLSTEY